MRAEFKLLEVPDVNGLPIRKGDIVVPICGAINNQVIDVELVDGIGFVSLRPMYQTFRKGVWPSADRVQRVQRVPLKPPRKRRSRRKTAPRSHGRR